MRYGASDAPLIVLIAVWEQEKTLLRVVEGIPKRSLGTRNNTLSYLGSI